MGGQLNGYSSVFAPGDSGGQYDSDGYVLLDARMGLDQKANFVLNLKTESRTSRTQASVVRLTVVSASAGTRTSSSLAPPKEVRSFRYDLFQVDVS